MHIKTTFRFLLMILSLSVLAACVSEPLHQGNRIKVDESYMIHEGDTKFRVEQALGTPVLKDSLHPNRVTYIEQFEDEESGDIKTRSIQITYDEALRVKTISRSGFDEGKK